MIKQKYWIITRFNAGVYAVRGHELATKWMENRMTLFEKYTAKSIRNQDDKEFEWLLLIDPETEAKYIKRIMVACDGIRYTICPVPGFKPKKFGERLSTGGEIAESIRNVVCGASKVSIQTRLDSDDIFSPNMVSHTKSILSKVRPELTLDYCNGYVYDTMGKQLYRAYHEKGSPWITGYYYNESKKTIYDYIHAKYNGIGLISDKGLRAWVMILHDMNITNKLIDKMNPVKADIREVDGWW